MATRHTKLTERAREKLEQCALEYARLKTLGIEINKDGAIIVYNRQDANDMLGIFLQRLGQVAIDLHTEISLTPLPKRKTK